MRGAVKSRAVAGVAIAAACALICACGRTGHGGAAAETTRDADTTGVLSGAPLSRHAPASLRRGALAPVGTPQPVDAAGAHLVVTLRQVIDPLRGSGAQLPAHARAVGVFVQIRSSGPRLYDSSATGDISVLASNGRGTPVLATHGICRTPLDDFDRYITAGEDRVGCVVFAVGDGATLDSVRFSPHARARGRLTWAT